MPQYISTDPNAGQAPPARPRYLSNDPNAGAQAPSGPAPQEGRSVSGFGSNLLESGGRFIGDIANTVLHPIDTAKGLATAVAHPIDTAKAIGGGLKDRYGSLDAIGNTLYEDPVGAAADASTLLLGGGGALRTLGRVANAPRATQTGRLLTTASNATNPMRAVTAPIHGVAREMGIGAVRGTVRPPKSVRDDFGGSREIAKTIIDEGITTERGAGRRLTQSRQAADALLAERQAAGVRGVPARDVARSVGGAPMQTAQRREVLGVADPTAAVNDRAQRILSANAVPGAPNATRIIPLTESQALKREAQDLAYDAGKQGLSLDKQANEAIARALREGIEARVPEVGPINQRSQRLIGAQRAMFEAEDRPQALTNMLASGFGIGTGVMNPIGGVVAAGTVKAMNSPRVGAMTGIGLDRMGRGVNSDAMIRAAILARLLEQQPDE